MTLRQLLAILRARLPMIFIVLSLTLLSALAASFLLPKKYTAGAAVVVDVKSPDPIAGMVLPALISPGYMATQVDIVNSDRVAQRVVRQLHLDDDATFQQSWQDATQGKGDRVAWLASQLQKKLDVKPSRESNVININFSGSDPAFAAAAANAFVQAYIDVNLDLTVAPARQSAAWFEEQSKVVRERLEAAQKAYSAYQQRTGVVATDERLDIETARLNELSTQLTLVQGETTESRSKSMSAGGSGTLGEVMQNPLINSLKTDIARLESKLDESNVNLGKNHPQTQRTESELASLKSKLDSETRKIVSSIGTSYQVGRQREKALSEAIAEQKTHLLGLGKQRDDIAVLRRDLESAQKAFDDVSQRAAQKRLESLSVLTNVAVLNPASEPTEPSSPNVRLNLVVALFLGSMLGAALALLFEITNRRVRSVEDLAEATGLPPLAAIPHTPDDVRHSRALPSRLRRFVTQRKPFAIEAT